MKNTDPRIDAYIENAPEFAQPIMTRVRKLFHRAYPDIGETIKWSSPTFEHKGIVGGMGAFKKHVSFGFWKSKAMSDPENLFEGLSAIYDLCGRGSLSFNHQAVPLSGLVRI